MRPRLQALSRAGDGSAEKSAAPVASQPRRRHTPRGPSLAPAHMTACRCVHRCVQVCWVQRTHTSKDPLFQLGPCTARASSIGNPEATMSVSVGPKCCCWCAGGLCRPLQCMYTPGLMVATASPTASAHTRSLQPCSKHILPRKLSGACPAAAWGRPQPKVPPASQVQVQLDPRCRTPRPVLLWRAAQPCQPRAPCCCERAPGRRDRKLASPPRSLARSTPWETRITAAYPRMSLLSTKQL